MRWDAGPVGLAGSEPFLLIISANAEPTISSQYPLSAGSHIKIRRQQTRAAWEPCFEATGIVKEAGSNVNPPHRPTPFPRRTVIMHAGRTSLGRVIDNINSSADEPGGGNLRAAQGCHGPPHSSCRDKEDRAGSHTTACSATRLPALRVRPKCKCRCDPRMRGGTRHSSCSLLHYPGAACHQLSVPMRRPLRRLCSILRALVKRGLVLAASLARDIDVDMHSVPDHGSGSDHGRRRATTGQDLASGPFAVTPLGQFPWLMPDAAGISNVRLNVNGLTDRRPRPTGRGVYRVDCCSGPSWPQGQIPPRWAGGRAAMDRGLRFNEAGGCGRWLSRVVDLPGAQKGVIISSSWTKPDCLGLTSYHNTATTTRQGRFQTSSRCTAPRQQCFPRLRLAAVVDSRACPQGGREQGLAGPKADGRGPVGPGAGTKRLRVGHESGAKG